MQYVYKGEPIKDSEQNIIVDTNQIVEGAVKPLPTNDIECLVAPCKNGDQLLGIEIAEGIVVSQNMLEPYKPNPILEPIKKITNKKMLIAFVTVLFLLMLYFNKQLRAFLTA